MFSFVKMKFITYNKVCSLICKEKTRSNSQKNGFRNQVRLHQENQKTLVWSKVFQLLIFESLQRQSENHSKDAKLLENHSKPKHYGIHSQEIFDRKHTDMGRH